jgi:hypothetical protein
MPIMEDHGGFEVEEEFDLAMLGIGEKRIDTKELYSDHDERQGGCYRIRPLCVSAHRCQIGGESC